MAAARPLSPTPIIDMRFSGVNNWKFGQFNYPFDIFQMMSDKTLMFVERPAGTEGSDLIQDDGFFRPLNKSRDIGVMYYGYSENKRFNWAVSVMNGNGVNQMENENNKFRMGLRFEVQNEGGFKYTMTAVDHPDKNRVHRRNRLPEKSPWQRHAQQ